MLHQCLTFFLQAASKSITVLICLIGRGLAGAIS